MERTTRMTRNNIRLFLIIVAFCAFAYFLGKIGWWNDPADIPAPREKQIAATRPVDPLRQGTDFLIAGRYDDAIRRLDEYLGEQERGPESPRALLLIGKAQLGQGNLDQARETFRQVVNEYPGTPEAGEAGYQQAMIAFYEGNLVNARRLFQELADARDTPRTPDAQAMLRHLTAGD